MPVKRQWPQSHTVAQCVQLFVLVIALCACIGIAIGISFASYNDGVSGAPNNAPLRLSEAYNRQAQPRQSDDSGNTVSSSGGLALRVLQYNTRYRNTIDKGWRQWTPRSNALAFIVSDVDPDICGFQEVLPSQYRDLMGYFPGYESAYLQRDPAHAPSEGAPLFWRRSTFKMLSKQTRWLSDTPDVPGSRTWGNFNPRICTSARLLHLPTNRVITVFNAHYDQESAWARVASSTLISGWMASALSEGPVLMTGDLNAYDGPGDAAVTTLMRGVPGLVDVLSAADPEAGSSGTFHGFTGEPSDGRIDYIFAASSRGVHVQRAWIDARKGLGILPSDHFGVVADVEV